MRTSTSNQPSGTESQEEHRFGSGLIGDLLWLAVGYGGRTLAFFGVTVLLDPGQANFGQDAGDEDLWLDGHGSNSPRCMTAGPLPILMLGGAKSRKCALTGAGDLS